MLFLDGVYTERADGSVAFRWVKAPTSGELTELAQRIAQRIGRLLERHGLLERDAEGTYSGRRGRRRRPDGVAAGAFDHLAHRRGSTGRALGADATDAVGVGGGVGRGGR